MSFDDDSDDDPLMCTVTGARDDDESGLYSPATGGLTERGACPSFDAYPIGSRVCLPDTAEDLRVLQQDEHWEPYPMEDIAGTSGVVVRHTGDYTLVQFFLEDVKVCTTIFRGALLPVSEGDELEELQLAALNDDGGGVSSTRSSATSNSGALAMLAEKSMTEGIGGLPPGSQGITSPVSVAGEQVSSEKAILARSQYDDGAKCFGLKDYAGAVRHFSASLVALVGGEEHRLVDGAYSIPTAVGAHYILSNRSVAHLALGNHTAAFEDAQLAISIKPSSTKGYVRAGNVHRTLRQYTQAKKMFSTALKADPTNPEIQYLLRSSQVAELYSKNSNLNQVHVSLSREGGKVSVRSRKTTDNLHQLIAELPLFGVPCTAGAAAGKGCDYCCRTLVEPHVLEAAKAISPQLYELVAGRLGNHFPAVPCINGCGVLYCSSACRDRALVSFHAVECSAANTLVRWPALDLCASGSGGLTEVECSQLHLALRIIATAITRIRAERPSNFDSFILELLPALPQDRAGLSPSMAGAMKSIYQSLLTHSLTTTNEKNLVTEAHWIRVVCVVVADAKFVSCHPWEEVTTSLWTRCTGSAGAFDPSDPLSPSAAGVTLSAAAQSPGPSYIKFSMSREGGHPTAGGTRPTISTSLETSHSGGLIDFQPSPSIEIAPPEDDEATTRTKKLLETQVTELATKTVEGLSCRNQACVLFPTLPHLKRSPQGNVKVYHQGFWKPTLVGVTTRPVRASEEVTIEETNNGFTACCARQCGAQGAGIAVCAPGLGSTSQSLSVARNRERGSANPLGSNASANTSSVRGEPNTPFMLEKVPTGMD